MRALFLLLSNLLVMSTAVAVEQISVQALLGKKAVLLIDGERHVLSEGQSGPDGIKVISVDPERAVLEVDGERASYTLGSSVSLSFTERKTVSETLFADDRGMYSTIGTINGQPVDFLVDTGATLIAMNRAQAKQLGLRYRIEGEPAGASTASGFVKGYKIRLRSVTVGRIKRTNVEAMVIDGTHPGPILLGMSFLGALKVEKSGNSLTVIQSR